MYIDGFDSQVHQPTVLARRCAILNAGVPGGEKATGFVTKTASGVGGVGPTGTSAAVNEPSATALEVGFSLSEYDCVLDALLGGEL